MYDIRVVPVEYKPESDYIGDLFITRAHVVMIVVHLASGSLAMMKLSRSKVTMTRQGMTQFPSAWLV